MRQAVVLLALMSSPAAAEWDISMKTDPVTEDQTISAGAISPDGFFIWFACVIGAPEKSEIMLAGVSDASEILIRVDDSPHMTFPVTRKTKGKRNSALYARGPAVVKAIKSLSKARGKVSAGSGEQRMTFGADGAADSASRMIKFCRL